jgi:hypothetical protein
LAISASSTYRRGIVRLDQPPASCKRSTSTLSAQNVAQ